MEFLPFDYLVIANQDFDEISLTDTFSFFSSCGIRKFICLLNFNRAHLTMSMIKDRKKHLESMLAHLHPKGLTVRTLLNLELSEGVIRDPSIKPLFVGNTPFLFVTLPLFCDDSWINQDLNYLLYRAKMTPVITSFEGNIRTGSASHIDHFFQTDAHILSLDLNYLTASNSSERIAQIISREIPIVPCISHSLSNYVGVLQAFDDLRERIGATAYVNLSRRILSTEKQLFPQPYPQHHYCTKQRVLFK